MIIDIDGGNGNDILHGGQGNDRLEGGNNDTLMGRADADYFSGGSGPDTSTDYNAGEGDTGDGTWSQARHHEWRRGKASIIEDAGHYDPGPILWE